MGVVCFIFRRDLRIHDNTTLLKALQDGHTILPIFIFNPKQVDPKKNAYFSNGAVQFMCESLKELAKECPSLLCFYGNDTDILAKLHTDVPFSAVYTNKDMSVFAQKRDQELRKWCGSRGIDFISEEDYGLFGSHEGLLSNGQPYKVLAMYYKRYLKDLHVRAVSNEKLDKSSFKVIRSSHVFPWEKIDKLYLHNEQIAQHGGRSLGLAILKKLKMHKNYKNTRDFPALEGTTKVSAHLKFGTISIREMYHACVEAFGTRDHPLIRELIFRDFYMKIYSMQPELQRGSAVLNELDKRIPWKYDKTLWKAWTTGTTGFPLVDAGIRQLLKENWCHNRVRMLVASVATKYLLLDWRDCARWFYCQLVDADTFSNTAGWQWSCGVGVDAVPYWRAPFNPFLQSAKFDANAEYIRKYVPELHDVATKDIHKWNDPIVRAKYPSIAYPEPIVDHKEASASALRIWKAAART